MEFILFYFVIIPWRQIWCLNQYFHASVILNVAQPAQMEHI